MLATRLGDGHQRLIAATDAGEDSQLASAARAALDTDRAATIELDDETWLVAPYNPPLRLLVIGAVHITQALVPLARLLDFEVTVIDPRRAFGTLERFSDVTLSNEWPAEALERLGIDHRTAIVALTHDKKLDDPALALALESPAFYIGALGSRRTQEARNERLRSALPGADLARINGPIGLPIGARSPAEIAVAIVAEIIQARHRAAPS